VAATISISFLSALFFLLVSYAATRSPLIPCFDVIHLPSSTCGGQPSSLDLALACLPPLIFPSLVTSISAVVPLVHATRELDFRFAARLLSFLPPPFFFFHSGPTPPYIFPSALDRDPDLRFPSSVFYFFYFFFFWVLLSHHTLCRRKKYLFQ